MSERGGLQSPAPFRFSFGVVAVEWLFRRPAAIVSGAFLMGAALEGIVPERPSFQWLPFLLAGAFSPLLLVLKGPWRLLPAAFCVFCLGFGFTRSRLPPTPKLLTPPFTAVLASSPSLTPFGTRLLIQLEGTKGYAIVWVPEGTLQCQVGDRLFFQGFRGRVTRQRRYRFRNILWVGTVSIRDIHPLEATGRFRLQLWRERWRQIVLSRWRKSLPFLHRTVTFAALSSLVFGMRTGVLGEAEEEAMRRSGLIHLFVPSGSQVTLLMGLAWLAHRYAGVPPFPLLFFLLGFYLPLTRGEPSIFRAVLMGLYAFGGWRWWRDVDWATALWLSSAILVAIDPSMLYDVSFQLSYAATFGLIYAMPLFLRVLGWMPQWLQFPIAATLSAQLFLTPLLVYYFGRMSLIAPLANLFAAVPASFALTFGFLSALLASLFPPLAFPLSVTAGFCARFVLHLAYFFASFPWASLWIASPSTFQITLLYMSLIVIIGRWKQGLPERRGN